MSFVASASAAVAESWAWLPFVPTFSAAAAVTAALLGLFAWRRDKKLLTAQHDLGRRKAMTDAHLQMTSGEVAEARHRAGALVATRNEDRAAFVGSRHLELLRDFYTLCWTLEYVENVRTAWLRNAKGEGPSTFLKWNEEALFRSAKSIRDALVTFDGTLEETTQDVWVSVVRIARARGFA